MTLFGERLVGPSVLPVRWPGERWPHVALALRQSLLRLQPPLVVNQVGLKEPYLSFVAQPVLWLLSLLLGPQPDRRLSALTIGMLYSDVLHQWSIFSFRAQPWEL